MTLRPLPFSGGADGRVPSCLAAAAVGAAQGVLSSYLAVTSERVTRGAVAGANKMAEFPTIQLRVTEAAASVDAARTILLRDIRATEDALRAQGLATDRVAHQAWFEVRLHVMLGWRSQGG